MSTTATNTMNDIADSLEEAAANIENTLLDEGGDIKEFASKTVYSTFYYFSYGVCFVSFLAGKVIPKNGVVGQGLRDGAAAAKDAVDRIAPETHQIDDAFESPIDLSPKPSRTKKAAAAPAKKRQPKKAAASAKKASEPAGESANV